MDGCYFGKPNMGNERVSGSSSSFSSRKREEEHSRHAKATKED